ncbi:P-type ATPase [Schizosaccharomyces japonicus yFS275]|uniref:Phospholipid-transporting ATPase n=1 Tax=Schizosaccharomyces japonicus (strain yFS275 / FY16936) TaxID=402676 RepID=B6JW96_SCHJY|nr:P-type ATPase [Schizosaccharomyces japonicus yFS275]EEB05647.1 P-type ATPase [Schizosaccharomyces japonicus yFS275]
MGVDDTSIQPRLSSETTHSLSIQEQQTSNHGGIMSKKHKKNRNRPRVRFFTSDNENKEEEEHHVSESDDAQSVRTINEQLGLDDIRAIDNADFSVLNEPPPAHDASDTYESASSMRKALSADAEQDNNVHVSFQDGFAMEIPLQNLPPPVEENAPQTQRLFIPPELLRIKKKRRLHFFNPMQWLGDKIAAFSNKDHRYLSSGNRRRIIINPESCESQIDSRNGKPFIGNEIITSRYTKYNFLPLQIIAQFSKVANCYFLLISILQMIPGWSTTGTYTTIIPLLLFITISICREGYDSCRRSSLDRVENANQVKVLRHVRNEFPVAKKTLRTRFHRRHPSSGMTKCTMDSKESVETKEVKDTTKEFKEAAFTATEPLEASAPPASTSLNTVVEETSTATVGPAPSIEATIAPSDTDSVRPTVNADPSAIPSTFFWSECDWKDVRVGDIIRLTSDEAVPADVIALSCSSPIGAMYVETAALDGETSLKTKLINSTLQKRCCTVDKITKLRGECISEDPNGDLYNFTGVFNLEDCKHEIPLSNNDIIYRGSIIRNTKELFALVVFTGEETKIRMNAVQKVHVKTPVMQKITNGIVSFIFVFVLSMAIFCTAAYFVWQNNNEDKLWYMFGNHLSVMPVLISFIILFNTMVPISLYVSMEVIRAFQSFLIQNDLDMYYEPTATHAVVRTSTILEDLGQVTHIFSDKTGTLTDNIMLFRHLIVAGQSWQHLGPEKPKLYVPGAKPGDKLEEYNDPELEGTTVQMLRCMHENPYTNFSKMVRMFLLNLALCHTCFPTLDEETDSYKYQTTSPDELALVHTAQQLGYVVTERDVDSVSIRQHYPLDSYSKPTTKSYRILNVIEFNSKRKRMSVIVRMPNGRICLFCKGADSVIIPRLRLNKLAHKKLNTVNQQKNLKKSVEIDRAIARHSQSTARPSLTASRPSMNRHRRDYIQNMNSWLDERRANILGPRPRSSTSVLQPRRVAPMARHSLAYGENVQSFSGHQHQHRRNNSFARNFNEAITKDDAAMFESTFSNLNSFASEGLRTLLYTHRYLTEEEYSEWKSLNDEAASSLTNRQELVEAAAELIETKLELTGATAIEDKLQDGVPETINAIQRAGISFWMLTGDKRETAINIGHSCGIIKEFSTVVILGVRDPSEGSDESVKGGKRLSMDHHNFTDPFSIMIDQLVSSHEAIRLKKLAHLVLVVDGSTLEDIEADEDLSRLFLNVVVEANAVICCRASPMQKAQMVGKIRESIDKSVTLAIGDGANDIAMIQEAHVGIGIAGREGLQAARSSDFSIARFKFMVKLLFCHGRWNYVRLSKYILGTFYKELYFFLQQAIFQRFAGYTGTSLYENWSLTCFNTLFSSLCVICIGIFDKDLSAATLISVPELYQTGITNEAFNWPVYLGSMAVGFSQGFLVFYCAYAVFGLRDLNDGTLFAIGQLLFTISVILINVKLMFLELRPMTIVPFIVVGLTVFVWFLFNIFISQEYSGSVVYLAKSQFIHHFGRNAAWWFSLFFIVITALLVDVSAQLMRRSVKPTDTDIFANMENDAFVRSRFEQESSEFLRSETADEEKQVEDFLAFREV